MAQGLAEMGRNCTRGDICLWGENKDLPEQHGKVG